MKIFGRKTKKVYKLVITQEGARKYQLFVIAVAHLPYEDFHLWDTDKKNRPGKGRDVIYLVRVNENQRKLIEETFGDYIVSLEEVEEL